MPRRLIMAPPFVPPALLPGAFAGPPGMPQLPMGMPLPPPMPAQPPKQGGDAQPAQVGAGAGPVYQLPFTFPFQRR